MTNQMELKNTHVFCGHNIDECNLNGYDFIEHLNNIKM